MNIESIPQFAIWAETHPLLIALILIWSLVWKGFALWKSAELRQKYWFIAILIVNSFGIIEIIYLFLISPKYKVEVIEKIIADGETPL